MKRFTMRKESRGFHFRAARLWGKKGANRGGRGGGKRKPPKKLGRCRRSTHGSALETVNRGNRWGGNFKKVEKTKESTGMFQTL